MREPNIEEVLEAKEMLEAWAKTARTELADIFGAEEYDSLCRAVAIFGMKKMEDAVDW